MQITERDGGLAVAWQEQGQEAVQREIRKLDPELFLDPERDPETKRIYWTVKQHLGSGTRPHRVLVWRDDNGNPLPLSMAIVDVLKRRERRQDADRAFLETLRENEQRRQRLHAEAADDLDTVEADHRKRIRAAELDSLPPYWRPRRFGRS